MAIAHQNINETEECFRPTDFLWRRYDHEISYAIEEINKEQRLARFRFSLLVSFIHFCYSLNDGRCFEMFNVDYEECLKFGYYAGSEVEIIHLISTTFYKAKGIFINK